MFFRSDCCLTREAVILTSNRHLSLDTSKPGVYRRFFVTGTV